MIVANIHHTWISIKSSLPSILPNTPVIRQFYKNISGCRNITTRPRVLGKKDKRGLNEGPAPCIPPSQKRNRALSRSVHSGVSHSLQSRRICGLCPGQYQQVDEFLKKSAFRSSGVPCRATICIFRAASNRQACSIQRNFNAFLPYLPFPCKISHQLPPFLLGCVFVH